MSSENPWKATFLNWPTGIPRRGVLVNSLNESMPFKSFLIKDHLLLLERTNVDPLGSRFILIGFESINSVRFVDPIKESTLNTAGFAGKLATN
jgi:hypothetical protein